MTYLLRRPKVFTLVEIGVFKGDNASGLIRLLKRFRADVFYVGFDLFEEKDEFFKRHPEDRAMYDTPEYPYYEFSSGEHALANVHRKISAVLSPSRFKLIPGASVRTLPPHRQYLLDASVIYIDGCHDYEIVQQDWENVRCILEANPNVLIVFDDALYPGVDRLKREIERSTAGFTVYRLNQNQFFVASKELHWRERLIFRLLGQPVTLPS
jgi:hypothetical protein